MKKYLQVDDWDSRGFRCSSIYISSKPQGRHSKRERQFVLVSTHNYFFESYVYVLSILTNQQENETLVAHTAWKMIGTRNITRTLNILEPEPITNSVEWLFKFLWIADKELFLINIFIFYHGFLHRPDDSQDSRGREGTIFYSTLPLPPAHEHSDIYLQLCMWDDYHVFLIATLVFTRLLLDEIYHLIELLFRWLIDDAMFVCLLDELILGFVTAIWHWEPVDLNSHQLSPLYYKVNRLTKCASHPI